MGRDLSSRSDWQPQRRSFAAVAPDPGDARAASASASASRVDRVQTFEGDVEAGSPAKDAPAAAVQPTVTAAATAAAVTAAVAVESDFDKAPTPA